MFTLNCKGRILVLDKPIVMGIINLTPDSFYNESRINDNDSLLRRAEKMLKEGAVLLDIGGQSTRPGSERLSAEEELSRVIGPVTLLAKNFPESFISIDTYHARVADEAVNAGAVMVNDISAGNLDPMMLSTIASLGVPYVLMHMKGSPATMQENPQYKDVTREVLDFFIEKLAQLRKEGIVDVIIDPGFGFGKTIQHNFELLKRLSIFKVLDRPVLLGISRKSTIHKTLGITVEQALNGTTVLNTIGLMNGAGILRVHDVKEAMEAIKLVQCCLLSG